jgi:hypothetical protein
MMKGTYNKALIMTVSILDIYRAEAGQAKSGAQE